MSNDSIQLKRNPRYFVHYWTNETWKDSKDEEGEQVGWLYSTRFISRGVTSGDFIYPVTVIKGELYLIAKIEVDAVCESYAANERIKLGLYEPPPGTEDIAFPRRSTSMNFHCHVPAEITRELTFISDNQRTSLVFRSNGGLDQQTLRGVRELTPQAAEMLDQLLPPLKECDDDEKSKIEDVETEAGGQERIVVTANSETATEWSHGEEPEMCSDEDPTAHRNIYQEDPPASAIKNARGLAMILVDTPRPAMLRTLTDLLARLTDEERHGLLRKMCEEPNED